MCGIFGFVSKNPLETSVILDGLKTLEYRGYDSWGIAIKNGKKLLVEKHTGKIGDSKTKFRKTLLGIGHTRWATHGGVTIENAHPHLDCTRTIAVVHNGIVENFEKIKHNLTSLGHVFLSETDTEVISHLVEEYLKTDGFATAVRKTFISLKGLNAIVVVNTISKEIIAAKNGSPLVIGNSSNTLFISSDISALIPYTKNLVILKDNHMVILGDNIKVVELPNGTPVSFLTETVIANIHESSKGTFPHYLLKEIYDQPNILNTIAAIEERNIIKLSVDITNAFGTYMLGCGTASYAAMAGEYFLSKVAHKHVNFSVGSEFKYLQDFITNKSLIIPISQSGETIDVVEPVQKAKEKGATIIPILNTPTSTLARLANYSVLLNAGQEKAVVGTKSFTAMVAVLLLIAYSVAHKLPTAEDLLARCASDVTNILSKHNIDLIKKLAKKLKSQKDMFLIGRGVSYVVALEGALKLKETALVHAEGFAGGELKHGVIALIENGTPCFVFAPNDETFHDIISNAQEIKARGGFIIGIGPQPNPVFDEFLKTADIGEATLIAQTVDMQLLAYFLALERGIEDPDKPRNLAKSVTVK